MNPEIKSNKLLYLEGIRGIAAFIVLICHLSKLFDPDYGETLFHQLKSLTGSHLLAHFLHAFLNFFIDGNFCVCTFWFMSAYVISIKLFGLNGEKYLITAFSKRYFRLLLPCLACVLIVYLLIKFNLMYNIRLGILLGREDFMFKELYSAPADLWHALRSVVWDTFFDFDPETTYNSAFWTMHPELYGSFLCFFLFGIFRTSSKRYYAYSIIIPVLFFIDPNFVGFLFGFLLCDIDHTDNWLKNINGFFEKMFFSKWYYASGFLIMIIFVAGSDLWAIPNFIVSAIFVYTIMRSSFLQTIFQLPFFVWLGKISFSLYLLHIPIMYSLTCYLYLQLNLPTVPNILLSCGITIIVTLFLSVLYTKYIDDFAVKFSNKIGSAFVRKAELKEETA